MQLRGLIIIVVAATVFENETNTEHTAKCVVFISMEI